jgi:hypothetical protein
MVDKLGNPPMTQWGVRAREQWTKFRPNMAKELSSEGCLDLAAILAQEGAATQYAEAVEAGIHPDEAKEIALNDWINLEDSEEPSTQERLTKIKENATFRALLAKASIRPKKNTPPL